MMINLKPVSSPTPSAEENRDIKYLDWKDRPRDLSNVIRDTYSEFASKSLEQNWQYRGNEYYGLAGTDERLLFKGIINENLSKRKKFYAVDLGGGNGAWAKAMMTYINQEKFSEDFKVTIYSLGAENTSNSPKIKEGKCTIKNWDRFRIENLSDELLDRQKYLEKKVDLIVSSYCLHHLVDPMGTLLQAYELLRPETGLLLANQFYFLVKDETEYDSLGLYLSLIDSKASFLARDGLRKEPTFILSRKDEKSLQMPLRYKGFESTSDTGIGSGCLTRFDFADNFTFPEYPDLNIQYNGLHGDKALYDRIERLQGKMRLPFLDQ